MMNTTTKTFRAATTLAMLAVLSLPFWQMTSSQAIADEPPCPSGENWPNMWGQAVMSDCDPHSSFTVQKNATGWHVWTSNEAGPFSNITNFEELDSFPGPSEDNIDTTWFDDSEPDPMNHYTVTVTITNEIVAVRGTDANDASTYLW